MFAVDYGIMIQCNSRGPEWPSRQKVYKWLCPTCRNWHDSSEMIASFHEYLSVSVSLRAGIEGIARSRPCPEADNRKRCLSDNMNTKLDMYIWVNTGWVISISSQKLWAYLLRSPQSYLLPLQSLITKLPADLLLLAENGILYWIPMNWMLFTAVYNVREKWSKYLPRKVVLL